MQIVHLVFVLPFYQIIIEPGNNEGFEITLQARNYVTQVSSTRSVICKE